MTSNFSSAALRPIAVSLAALLVACSSRAAAPAPAPPPPHVTLGVATLRISLPLYLAEEQHLFAAHGLDVEVRPNETAQPMVNDVVAGRVDAAGFAA